VTVLAAVCWSVSSQAQVDPRERYGTYLGGSIARETFGCYPDPACPPTDSPAGTAIDRVIVDGAGNTYVAGRTSAIDFPTTVGAYRRTANFACQRSSTCDSSDGFLAKFDASGHLLWSTYLGALHPGSVGRVLALGLDTSGNIALAGAGGADLCWNYTWMMKINSTGSSRVYSNVLTCDDYNLGTIAYAAAVDASGRYFYLDVSDSDGLYPVTPGAHPADPNFPSGRLIKIDTLKTTNNGIVYSAGTTGTYNPDDMELNLSGLAVNSSGNAFVIGFDTRVTKFDSAGATQLFSVKYLPSWASSAVGNAITTTSGGDVLFTAQVSPQGAYPATSSFGNITSGTTVPDTVVVRLNGSTGSRVYSTAIHDAHMTPLAIARNSANEPFVTGSNSGYQYSVNRYSTAPSKGAFLMRLTSTGTKVWLDSTFGGDAGYGVAIDAAWNAYVAGSSIAGEYFPITTSPYPAYQSSFKSAASQGFLAKLIIEADVKMIQSASPSPVTHGSNLTYTLSVFNNGPDVSNTDTITDVLPSGTTFVSFSTTSGTCTHPAVGSGGTFKCTRSTALNKGASWGPVKLTVHVNAAAGTTLKNTAAVAAKTQDVFTSNNTATVYVKVQ
jgi:uncharacterized repeat protein (TIGR01451 family)